MNCRIYELYLNKAVIEKKKPNRCIYIISKAQRNDPRSLFFLFFSGYLLLGGRSIGKGKNNENRFVHVGCLVIFGIPLSTSWPSVEFWHWCLFWLKAFYSYNGTLPAAVMELHLKARAIRQPLLEAEATVLLSAYLVVRWLVQ